MGEQLAEQAPVEADMVMGVPESGVPAAEGFARRSGIPFGQGVVKNRYIGRSFIAPSQELRARAVRMKLNPLRENIAGKRLVVVDDSIVRGTTQKQLTKMLREAGAREVHLRITSPPVKWPCFYGIDTGDRTELLAARLAVDEIREYLNVDSLAYLSLDRLKTATGAPGAGFCDACFTGDYPVAVPVTLRKHVLEEPATRPPRHAASRRRSTERRCDRWAPATRTPGVNISAGEEAVERIKSKVRSTFRPEVIGDIGGFGGLFAFAQHRYTHPVLVSSTDGVGTKALIAQAAGRFDTIGIDLVAMCVDDIVCQGAEPLFFLDYIAVGKLDPDHIEQLVEGVAYGCRQAGCALIGGEMAEHPGAMDPGEFDLVGFAVGVVERDRLITGEHVAAGRRADRAAVAGPAVQRLLAGPQGAARRAPAGTSRTRPGPGRHHSLADELLEPSVVYAPAIAALLRHVDVRAIAHITGGGLPGNLARVLPDDADAVVDVALVGGAADLRRDPAPRRGHRRRDAQGVQPGHRHGRGRGRRRGAPHPRPAPTGGPPGQRHRARSRPGTARWRSSSRCRAIHVDPLIVDDDADIRLAAPARAVRRGAPASSRRPTGARRSMRIAAERPISWCST